MITVLVPIAAGLLPGDALTAVGNFGASLSSEKAVHQRRVPVFDRYVKRAGFLVDNWLESPFLDGDPGGGFLEDFWIESPFLEPEHLVRVELRDVYGYGPFALAIVPEDAVGQSSVAPPTASVIFVAEPPLPLARHAFSAFNAGDGTVTFALTHGNAGG
ncbi:MAG TPA: hypothetical protein ENI79_01230 [Rhodospirillales bacterium]|nr:hypothetical protein [Rhodospirillales bacterium]